MEPPTRDDNPTNPSDGDPLPITRVVEEAARVVADNTPPTEPAAGLRIGEFLLIEEIGRGAFGCVYLAAQESLNRRVALKISERLATTQDEGKSLGGLEHDHIVKVYSAFTHGPTGWHCLCLQYVPGTDLRNVIGSLKSAKPGSGQDILAAIDACGRRDAAFDPAALRDRDALASDNFFQAVCRIGGRLADALAFAHAKGVLHCDIKPGNILMSPYGRPMLADFNVSFDRMRPGDAGGLGGTRGYMAPEYFDALTKRTSGGVDDRCDLYSLGVVLFELATGHRPDQKPDALDGVPRELAVVVRRCLEPDPAKRYPSAEDLASALSGAWHLLEVQRSLPPPDRFGRWTIARPALALALAAVIPHFAASIVNIGFNSTRLELADAQQRAFLVVMILYNLIAYPICLAAAVTIFRRVATRLPNIARAPGREIDVLRARVCRLGRQAVIIGAFGWFPGGLIFPFAIDILAGPLDPRVYVHFLISFFLSGLIGVVFSYLGVQYVVFRSLLPRLGNPDAFTLEQAEKEVRPLTAPFGGLVFLASTIPLTGAVLMIAIAEGTLTLGFRVLMVGLIGLGAFGVALAQRGVRRIGRLAAAWGIGEERAVESNSLRDTQLSGVYRKPVKQAELNS
jgi:serine/threonine protein kinase